MRISLCLFFTATLAFSENFGALEKRLVEYREHDASGFFSRSFVILYQDDQVVSGLGTLGIRKGMSFTSDKGFLKYSGLFERKTCAFEGVDCFWIDLQGMRYYPENTDSITIQGIKGYPARGQWNFTLTEGKICAFSSLPFGALDSAWEGGQGYALAKKSERKSFRERLKAVPEAYEAWIEDPLWAIKHFNAAIPATLAKDFDYEASDDPHFPSEDGIHEKRMMRRIEKNANDTYALGRLAELHCHFGEYDKAEKALTALRLLDENHFRYLLVKAYCTEKRGDPETANALYRLAYPVVPPFMVAPISNDVKLSQEKVEYAQAVQLDSSGPWGCEIEFGVGFPYALAGAGVAVTRKIGKTALSISMTEGLAHLFEKNPTPLLGARLILPGMKWRPYLGFSNFLVFSAKKQDITRYLGPDIGFSVDMGQPLGFYFRFGLGQYHVMSFINKSGERDPAEKILLPYLGVANAF